MQVRKSFAQYGLLSLLFCYTPDPTAASYVPGVVAHSYLEGSRVPLYVDRLTPMESKTENPGHSAVSRGYYHPAFRFCKPDGGPQDVGQESLGAVIFGDRIKTSPFELHMLKNESCKRLCDEVTFDAKSATFVNRRIWENLGHNWLIDSLPAGQPYQLSADGPTYYTQGFHLGAHSENLPPLLFNHFDIIIYYNFVGDGKYNVVGVEVDPSSRKSSKNREGTNADCGDDSESLTLNEKGETRMTWTYGVYWRSSPILWNARWDAYLHADDPELHWLSLVSTTIVVVFLISTVNAILLRALKRDFARYNRLESFNLEDFSNSGVTEDGIQEDSGWKLLHGDVFRPPRNPLLLSIFLGSGAQLLFMSVITMVFAILGFLSPSNRGSLGTAMIILYTILGFVGGYVSARVYKTFDGEAWKRNIVFTPILIPGIVFGTFFLLNLFLWAQASSGAVPFTTMLVLVALWFLISVPLSFVGSWIGFKQAVIKAPISYRSFLHMILMSTAIFLTRPHEPDTAPNSTMHTLPPSNSLDVNRGLLTLLRYLHRTLLHHE
ncbi:transmembrane 9 super member 2 [Ptychographa xylographoides]|nr:transmembrane 9 super member 2 [Ptychographa xylographoides]